MTSIWVSEVSIWVRSARKIQAGSLAALASGLLALNAIKMRISAYHTNSVTFQTSPRQGRFCWYPHVGTCFGHIKLTLPRRVCPKVAQKRDPAVTNRRVYH